MLYGINEAGSVINEARLEKIQKEYIPLLEEIGDFYKLKLNENLLSVYIRGSVSVGRAKSGVSDIDSVAITSEPISTEKQKEIFQFSLYLKEKYPFVTLVDMTVISLDTLLSEKEFSNLKIYLKTQSIHLYGEDIRSKIKDVKPGRGLALEMYGDLREKLQELEDYFSGIGPEKTYLGEKRPAEFWCVWTMRTILRSALGLVMIREPVYSQDLETCAEVFSSRYPGYKQYMDKALFWAMNPVSDKEKIGDYLKEFSPRYNALWEEALNN